MQAETDKDMTENNNTADKEKEVKIVEPENIENSGNVQSAPIDQSAELKKKAPESVSVAGVRFRSCGKVYTFDVGDLEVSPGTKVVVDSKMGLSLGNVVSSKHLMERKGEPFKKVLRIATEEDFETVKNNRSLEDEARFFCIEKVKDLNLPMKIVTTETTLDKKRLIFYFTADGRIDFRELVRDLAAKFKTRIEMRQIGVRDEVKLLGGFGVCGRQTCCSLFLTSFEPITIRMAKQQDLSINQSKLSGICGRLMCCLGYEYRDTPDKETASPVQKEPLVTITDKASDNNLQLVASESNLSDILQVQRECACVGRTMTEGTVMPVTPQKEKTSEGPSETGVSQKKRSTRDRRKRKRPQTAKTSPESTQGKQPETGPPDTAEKGESKNKGKSHNRRRKFWKKKKQ